MALIIKPEKLLKVLWEARFEVIFVYEDGSWDIDRKRRHKDIISLNRSELTETSKLEALNQLMILNTKLLEATTEEYADKAKKAYKKAHELWKEANIMSKGFAEIKGEEYCEFPFNYSPYSTVEEQFQEYYGQYLLEYIIDIQLKLSKEYNINLDFYIHDEGDASHVIDEHYNLDIPSDSKIAFFISDDKCRPVYFIDDNHPLFPKLQSEISGVPKLALDDAWKSVKKDLRQWFKSHYGYDIN